LIIFLPADKRYVSAANTTCRLTIGRGFFSATPLHSEELFELNLASHLI
jgi:hypothetical protein